MTPAQVAHIMSLVDELLRWKVINYSRPSDSSPKKLEEARAAVEAALRDAPQQAEPQGEPDVADIIAGALPTSRAHAYELMRQALKDTTP